MTLQDIEAFVAMAETGSVNRAALRLHRTQPATTRRLQNFEAALGGGPLLDRSAKPPVLTPAGRKALEYCRAVLKAVAELKTGIAQGGEVSGKLRIGVAHGLDEVVVGKPLDALRKRFPNVRLQVRSDWTRVLIEEVRTGALDCAIGLVMEEHALPKSVQVRSIEPEEVVVVAGSGARARSRAAQKVRLRDLAPEGWILNPAGCGCREALERAFERAKLPMRVNAEVLGEKMQLAMIARSPGLGLVPRTQLRQSAHRAAIKVVKVDDFSLHGSISLLHGQSLGRLAEAVDHLFVEVESGLRAR